MRKTTVSPVDPVPARLIKPGCLGSKQTPRLEVKKKKTLQSVTFGYGVVSQVSAF